jgi:hypothetical protein
MSLDHDQLPVPWVDLSRAFHVDGSFRDIVIGDTDLRDWERAYEFVRSLDEEGLARLEPDPDPLPSTVSEIIALRQDRSVRLGVHLGNVLLNCFFFGELEIEFDLDPKEVASEAEALSVVSFIRRLGRATGRPAHLTEESSHDLRWLTFDPSSDSWTFEPGG